MPHCATPGVKKAELEWCALCEPVFSSVGSPQMSVWETPQDDIYPSSFFGAETVKTAACCEVSVERQHGLEIAASYPFSLSQTTCCVSCWNACSSTSRVISSRCFLREIDILCRAHAAEERKAALACGEQNSSTVWVAEDKSFWNEGTEQISNLQTLTHIALFSVA